MCASVSRGSRGRSSPEQRAQPVDGFSYPELDPSSAFHDAEKPRGLTDALPARAERLGKDTQMCTPGELLDPRTGEVLTVDERGHLLSVRDPASVRLERYYLQDSARTILRGHRVGSCLRLRLSDARQTARGGLPGTVELYRSRESSTVHYGGLTVCGLGWVCPVCSAKISTRRRAELRTAVEAHQLTGGSVVLVTLTTPHGLGDELQSLTKGLLRDAYRKCRTGASWTRLVRSVGVVGTVRAVEVTYGVSGWHPHIHELWFLANRLSPESLARLRDLLAKRWCSSLSFAGLSDDADTAAVMRYGCDVRDGSGASDYIAKYGNTSSNWDHAAELTTWQSKRGRKTSLTPWDFLRGYASGDSESRAYYARLFRIYVSAFYRVHQLQWSKGLRARFGLGVELTDLELASAELEPADLLGLLNREQWRAVSQSGLRGELLEVARSGWFAVVRFVDELAARLPPAHFDNYGYE